MNIIQKNTGINMKKCEICGKEDEEENLIEWGGKTIHLKCRRKAKKLWKKNGGKFLGGDRI